MWDVCQVFPPDLKTIQSSQRLLLGNDPISSDCPTSYTSSPNVYAYYFNGANGLKTTNSQKFSFQTTMQTECWFYVNNYTESKIWNFKDVADTDDNETGTLELSHENSSVYSLAVKIAYYTNWYTGYKVPLHEWVHACITYTDGIMILYINGKEVSRYYTNHACNADYMLIGCHYKGWAGGYLQYFDGFISQFRYSRSVTYTGNFDPPLNPVQVLSDTVLLTCSSPTIENKVDNGIELNIPIGNSVSICELTPPWTPPPPTTTSSPTTTLLPTTTILPTTTPSIPSPTNPCRNEQKRMKNRYHGHLAAHIVILIILIFQFSVTGITVARHYNITVYYYGVVLICLLTFLIVEISYATSKKKRSVCHVKEKYPVGTCVSIVLILLLMLFLFIHKNIRKMLRRSISTSSSYHRF